MQTVHARNALFLNHPTRPRLQCTRQPHPPGNCARSASKAGTGVVWTGLRSAKRLRKTSADALSGDLQATIPGDKPDAETDLVRKDVDLPRLDRVRPSASALCR